MTMTVKKLIAELEKIENKFLEVELYVVEPKSPLTPFSHVQIANKKVWIAGNTYRK